MATIRKRVLKLLTLLVLLIFITSFILNFANTDFPENLKKFMKYSNQPCTCSRCIEQQGVSQWFDSRFNQSVQPLMTEQNSFLEEDIYRWWLRLQGEKNPNNLSDTIKKLFQVVPGNLDPLLEKRATDCRRCAVVGNSGNLRKSWYGSQIDNHDFVLRMNKAPTAGFEADVGHKTTHHLVYPESFRDLGENVSMILVPFKTLDLEWVVSAVSGKGTISQ